MSKNSDYIKGRLSYYTTSFIDLDDVASQYENPEDFKEGWMDASDDNHQEMIDHLEWLSLQSEE